MDLMILKYDPQTRSQMYRGTDRPSPSYVEQLPTNHSVNQTFSWYIHEGGQNGIVHDLARAMGLVDIHSQLNPPQYFEVVQITVEKQSPMSRGEHLGYDLSSGRYSLLSWNLEVDRKPRSEIPDDDPYWTLVPLLSLVKAFFQPQLNSNGLFDLYDVAQFCLDCMLVLQKIRSNLWENDEVNFRVVRLWKLDDVNRFHAE